MTAPRIRSPQGVVLIEALVALMIVALGIVALGGLQGNFSRSADLARQRGDALRLATRDLEMQRSHASADDIKTCDMNCAPDQMGFNVEYRLTRVVQNSLDDGLLKSVRVTVAWKDRAGDDQSVDLDSFIASADPGLGFALSQPADQSLRTASSRNVGVPPNAKDLGDGRSAYKPSGQPALIFVFNNVSGLITSKCTASTDKVLSDLASTDLSDCIKVQNGHLLSGTVRFSLVTPPSSEQPTSPALPLGFNLVLTSTHHLMTPSYECYGDAPFAFDSNQRLVLYDCLVYPNTDTPPIWSGYLDLSGLSFTGSAAVKVCRYSANYDGDLKNIISNAEHPEQYVDVTGSLRNQNFLVIKGSEICPAGHAVDASQGYYSNTATVMHQDASKPSHVPATTTGG